MIALVGPSHTLAINPMTSSSSGTRSSKPAAYSTARELAGETELCPSTTQGKPERARHQSPPERVVSVGKDPVDEELLIRL